MIFLHYCKNLWKYVLNQNNIMHFLQIISMQVISWHHWNKFLNIKKQSSIGVLTKRHSENKKWSYRKTPVPKCEVAMETEIKLQHACSPVNFLHIFRTPFYKNTSGGMPLHIKIFKSRIINSKLKKRLAAVQTAFTCSKLTLETLD